MRKNTADRRVDSAEGLVSLISNWPLQRGRQTRSTLLPSKLGGDRPRSVATGRLCGGSTRQRRRLLIFYGYCCSCTSRASSHRHCGACIAILQDEPPKADYSLVAWTVLQLSLSDDIYYSSRAVGSALGVSKRVAVENTVISSVFY